MVLRDDGYVQGFPVIDENGMVTNGGGQWWLWRYVPWSPLGFHACNTMMFERTERVINSLTNPSEIVFEILEYIYIACEYKIHNY